MTDKELIEDAEVEADEIEAEDAEIEDAEAEASDDEAPDDEQEAESEEEESAEAKEGEAPEDEGDEVLTVTIGGDDKPSEESSVIRNLRKRERDLSKRIRELEDAAKPAASDLGPKPTLEGCDYSEERFERELLAWQDAKRESDARAEAERQKAQEQERAWAERLAEYQTAKQSLGAMDYDDAEETVRAIMDTTQQAVIIDAADRPELVIYALGKNPEKAKALAGISNPVRFAAEVARMESKMKVEKVAKPKPEKRVKGLGSVQSPEKALDRLRKEAEKTGDYSSVMAFKAQRKRSA